MKWLRRHIIFTNLALIGIEAAVACLVWFIFDGRQTFGSLNIYVIVCVFVIAASATALNSQIITKWFRRHIILTNLVLIGVEILVACLVWFLFNGRQTFGPLNTYVIVCLSVVVASIAALNSLFTSYIASDTQRPFLYVAGSIAPKKSSNHVAFTFTIYNSGSLPAEDVQTDIQFFDKDEAITEENPSSKFIPPPADPTPLILFPNSEIYRSYVLNLKEANDAELLENIKQGGTKYRVRITYTSLGRKHITIQTGELAKVEWEKTIAQKPIPPQKWK